MKGTKRLLTSVAFIMAASAALAAAGVALAAEENPDILKVIAEKTRQREDLYDAFDGFDWRQSSISYYGAVGSEVMETTSNRSVRSRGCWLMASDRLWRPGVENRVLLDTAAFDGKVLRELKEYGRAVGSDEGDYLGGAVVEGEGWRARAPSRYGDGMGVTYLPARLSDALAGNLDDARVKNPDYWRLRDCDFEVSLKGEKEIDGRKCWGVDYVIKPRFDINRTEVTRFYFAPDLGYASVCVEEGHYENGELWLSNRRVFSDFREVDKGLFIPFDKTSVSFKEGTAEQFERPAKFTTVSKTTSFVRSWDFDDSLFTIAFPPGTDVNDHITKTRYVVGEAGASCPRDAIAEGPEDEVVPEGAGSTSDAVAEAGGGTASTSGKPATGERARPQANWLAPGVIAGVAAAGAVGLILARRRRRGK